MVQFCILSLTIEYVIGYYFLHKYNERFWSTYCNLKSFSLIKYFADKLKIVAKFKDAIVRPGMTKSDGGTDSNSDSDCIYECTCDIKCDYNITWNEIFE